MRSTIDQTPSNSGEGGVVLNMFAQANLGQLSLMDAVVEPPVTNPDDTTGIEDELPADLV